MTPSAAAARKLLGRLREGLRRTAAELGGRLDGIAGASPDYHEQIEAVEETLLGADVGVAAAARIIGRLRAGAASSPAPHGLRELVRQEILQILSRPKPIAAAAAPPHVVLVVGVNGAGKTTTVGKLARLLRRDGRRPLICAADTFRAAAVEQLAVWAGRADVDLVRARAGGDPAAVVFDAVRAAQARDRDVVLVDTAGRLHTRADLMAELGKIARVAARSVEGAPHEALLVLDATVGQNGLAQARQFLERVPVTGVVLAKLDGTAKGGVAVAVVSELGVPVRYVGVGEAVDDLLPFSAEEYVDALFARP